VTAALALPFLLGLGMALPWPGARDGLSVIPRPGPWMVRVKQAFGVFILGTAIYYGTLAYGLFSQRWVDPAAVADSVAEMLEEGWHASLSQGLQTARLEQKPVLVDVWATWCKNCLTMDRTTLKDPAVQEALDGVGKELKGSRVLVLGAAYKPDVADARESAAIEILRLLLQEEAAASYHDPYIKSLADAGVPLASVVELDGEVGKADCVVIATAHSIYDRANLAGKAAILLDTSFFD